VARRVRDRRVRYVAVGALSSATYYGLFSAVWLAGGGSIPYLAVAVLANGATAALTYPLYRRGVWRTTAQGLRGFFRFYAVTLWALAFNLVALPILVEWVGLPVLLAQAIIIIVSPLINYQLMRFWAFRRARDGSTEA
jgi:putative flippase GtrA